jgi:hypothetical protein
LVTDFLGGEVNVVSSLELELGHRWGWPSSGRCVRRATFRPCQVRAAGAVVG